MSDIDPKVEADLKAQYEKDIAAVKSAKDKEISELRKSHEELTSKMQESDAVVAKLTGDDATKKKADSVEALRAKLIKEGTPEETLKFAETEREMNMIASVYKNMPKPPTRGLDTGGGSSPSTGKPSFTGAGTHFRDLEKWAETEQNRIRAKYGI